MSFTGLSKASKCKHPLSRKEQQGKNVTTMCMHTACINQIEIELEGTNDVPLGSSGLQTKLRSDKSMHAGSAFYDSLIENHVKSNELHQALNVYEKLQEGDHVNFSPYTFTHLLKASTALKDSELGALLHVDVARKGLLEKDIFIGSMLVDMYAKCGIIHKAQEVFDKLPNQNVVSWTSLIAGYNNLGSCNEALKLVERMQQAGITSNSYTLVCSLKACGSLGMAEKGAELHLEIMKRGLEMETLIGNTTIDMYARCGLFDNAHAVLERLLPQDVISWNALITGYVEHEYGERALHCFALMQSKGIAPGCITLSCCLKACASIGAVLEAEKIYSQVYKLGLENDQFVNTFMVDMYAKCGSFAKAQEMLTSKFSTSDAVSWTALITGYSKHGYHHDALACFERMQQEALSPNACTLVCSLKACESIASLEKGEEVYHQILAKGFDKETVASNILIGLYAKKGLFTTAQAVFARLSMPDMFAWNALIMGYSEHGSGEEALFCFEQMQQKGIFYDAATLGCCLKACGVIGATIKGHEIHAEVCKKGLNKELLMSNYLIDMYCGCGLLSSAQAILNKLSARDIFTWNAVLAGYSDHGYKSGSKLSSDEALTFTGKMQHDGVSPNGYTYVHSLKACSIEEDVHEGRNLHHGVVKQGLEKEEAVGVALVDFYLKCGIFGDALQVYNKLPAKELASSTAILSGYVELGLTEKALDFFANIQKEGVFPDAVMLVYVLKACVHLGSLCKGQNVHNFIFTIGLERDLLVSGTLICLYAKNGMLTEVQDMFKKLSVRDVVVWSALIAAYNEYGLVEKVLECSNQMIKEGIPWDSPTVVSILKACSSLGASVAGQELHSAITMTGLLSKNDLLVGNTLIDMYTKCGFFKEALLVFRKLTDRDVVSWNAAIAAFTQLGDIGSVFDSFGKMVIEGIKPDGISVINTLNACSHEGLVDEGWMCFETFFTGYGLVPEVEHYTCMADILGRAGLPEQAGALIQSMPLHPDMVGWTSVMWACKKWENLELGRHAYGQAVLLDENCTSPYIGMSNIFANASNTPAD